MTRPKIESMCPFFIVSAVERSLAFYQERLGFETQFKQPDQEPFFGIVGRDSAMLFIKAGEAAPLPNPKRDPAMRWDAYCYTSDPDALAAEFAGRGASFSNPLKDTSDGLRGFEITDPDGYVLFFGCPRPALRLNLVDYPESVADIRAGFEVGLELREPSSNHVTRLPCLEYPRMGIDGQTSMAVGLELVRGLS